MTKVICPDCGKVSQSVANYRHYGCNCGKNQKQKSYSTGVGWLALAFVGIILICIFPVILIPILIIGGIYLFFHLKSQFNTIKENFHNKSRLIAKYETDYDSNYS